MIAVHLFTLEISEWSDLKDFGERNKEKVNENQTFASENCTSLNIHSSSTDRMYFIERGKSFC